MARPCRQPASARHEATEPVLPRRQGSPRSASPALVRAGKPWPLSVVLLSEGRSIPSSKAPCSLRPGLPGPSLPRAIGCCERVFCVGPQLSPSIELPFEGGPAAALLPRRQPVGSALATVDAETSILSGSFPPPKAEFQKGSGFGQRSRIADRSRSLPFRTGSATGTPNRDSNSTTARAASASATPSVFRATAATRAGCSRAAACS